ncbi:hypothetical protein ISF_01933 [Cordyceps fumosorosea ARSEF 2679]|uniref:DUF1941 family protein n=1 Tax=Cordyceps fumosorosea (strain ARSEF 2679) TaxID=1081104 RepID=A0A162JN95_CORFA|nr:hypothetical protein ISF_01933 [Cordyceps fumosorosea ARSEF 2679]OAA71382.1 hypothetical protein ISF_01933 [Cordyceps fumosorosea ARSEF 2679]
MASQPSSDKPVQQAPSGNNITKLKALLKSKDDTQRFVGLALLKSLLDNTPEIRNDEAAVRDLWSHISPKFLDRLLRTGANPANANAKDMLDIGVSILYTFSVLLAATDTAADAFTARIPGLVAAALYSTGDTTGLLLQLLYTLVNSKEGAGAFMQVADTTPLTEIAASHAMVLDVFGRAWLHHMAGGASDAGFSEKIDAVIQALAALFKGTDAVTYLAFLGTFLSHAKPEVMPKNPKWLSTSASYIQCLVASRPAAEARAAYTSAAAGLLQAYPEHASELLFKDPTNTETPFGYLFVNLLLVDIRSSVPTLLAALNSPGYQQTSRRLASAFDIVCLFIGYLVRSLEDERLETLIMPPDFLLRIRKGISETISVTLEYVRDRWDAARSGAMGFDPGARAGKAETSTGSHLTIAWDAIDGAVADEDQLMLSALRTATLWLREDENEQLRKEGTGIVDVLVELFANSPMETMDFRPPVLVGLEGLVAIRRGRHAFVEQGGWQILTEMLVHNIQRHREVDVDGEAGICVDIVRVLLAVAEAGDASRVEAWLDLITAIAAWDVPDSGRADSPTPAQDAHVAVLQLCCTVLAQANQGMRNRYKHSIAAIAGIATQLRAQVGHLSEYAEQMEDVCATLDTIR